MNGDAVISSVTSWQWVVGSAWLAGVFLHDHVYSPCRFPAGALVHSPSKDTQEGLTGDSELPIGVNRFLSALWLTGNLSVVHSTSSFMSTVLGSRISGYSYGINLHYINMSPWCDDLVTALEFSGSKSSTPGSCTEALRVQTPLIAWPHLFCVCLPNVDPEVTADTSLSATYSHSFRWKFSRFTARLPHAQSYICPSCAKHIRKTRKTYCS